MAITEDYEEYDFLGTGIGDAPPELDIKQFMDIQGYIGAIESISYLGITSSYSNIGDIGDLKSVFNKIKSGVQTVISKVGTALKKGKDFVVGVVKGAIKKGKEVFEKAKSWGKKQVSKLTKGAKDLVNKAKKKATDTYNKVKEKFEKKPKEAVPTAEEVKEATHKVEIKFMPFLPNALTNLSNNINKVKTAIHQNLPFGWKLIGTTVAEGNKLNIYLKSPSKKISDIGIAPVLVPIIAIGAILVACGLIILGWKLVDLAKEKVISQEATTKADLVRDVMESPNLTQEQKNKALDNLLKEGLIEKGDTEALSLFGLPTWATVGLIGVVAFLLLSPKSPVQIIETRGKKR